MIQAKELAEERKTDKTTVVVALDGSDYSDLVIDWCAQTLFPTADEVTLVQAFGYSPMPEQICALLGGPILPQDEVDETNETLKALAREKATKSLRKYSQQMMQSSGRKADNLVPLLAEVQQKAKYALLKYVEKVTPDFLVCGSRGMGAVGRALLGSTSDFLAHNANCSVVIVKGDLPNKAKSREREVDVDVLEDEEDSREEARGGEAGEENGSPAAADAAAVTKKLAAECKEEKDSAQ
eukprot:CAMPEP_0170198798 /NCGR_PEP_ID=MMETSP0040_2-20121228/68983_1 /TAXON_ID=641309 /ORGANISM="Lotharella oceanica, Strain CCMP622" /LENGTH=238 /DNA_ID=CAMNT_0010448847 /DNA_START=525 /DNA_END=1242 /DNA_ORIENTATION=-